MEKPSAATASSATSSPHPPPSPSSAAPAPAPPTPPTPPAPALPPTTFVQADPQSFREVVQKLTGAAAGDSPDKLPVTAPARPAAGPRRPPFKLLDRRPSLRKLEIKLGRASIHSPLSPRSPHHHLQHHYSQPQQYHHHHHHHHPYLTTPPAVKSPSTFPSPVSPLGSEMLFSPAAAARAAAAAVAASAAVEEDRAIAEKGFYLIPSPRTADPPELLPLFPLTSPRQSQASEQ